MLLGNGLTTPKGTLLLLYKNVIKNLKYNGKNYKLYELILSASENMNSSRPETPPAVSTGGWENLLPFFKRSALIIL